jgi:hypothetical protein
MKLTAVLLTALHCVLTAVPVFALNPHVDAVLRIVEGV